MKHPHNRTWTQAEIAKQAFEMLAIGNVAARRAQAKNRALGIPTAYSFAIADSRNGSHSNCPQSAVGDVVVSRFMAMGTPSVMKLKN